MSENLTTERITQEKRTFNIWSLGSLIFLIVLVAGLSIYSPEFRTYGNFLSLLRQATINGLIAFGMTVVILTGAIDLSVGGVLGLTAMLCAGFIKGGFTGTIFGKVLSFSPIPPPVAMILALLIGGIFGALSGSLVSYGKMQPFIATMATMIIFQGVTLILSDGKPISGVGREGALRFIGKGYVFGIPAPVILLAIVFGIFYFMLNHTAYGRHIYAIGSNKNAAKLAGISSEKTTISVYVISGIMSALAGLILLSRLGSAQPTLGDGYELDAIAAAALGGTSMNGGRGKISGTLIGVLIIAVLSNGLNIIGLRSYYQNVAKGIVILVAVLADREKD